MFEKREEMNKIRYGGIRGGKLVNVRAKVIAWSHVMLCTGNLSTVPKPPFMNTSFFTPTETLMSDLQGWNLMRRLNV